MISGCPRLDLYRDSGVDAETAARWLEGDPEAERVVELTLDLADPYDLPHTD